MKKWAQAINIGLSQCRHAGNLSTIFYNLSALVDLFISNELPSDYDIRFDYVAFAEGRRQ